MLVRASHVGAFSEAANDSPKKYPPSAVVAVASELLIAAGVAFFQGPRPTSEAPGY